MTYQQYEAVRAILSAEIDQLIYMLDLIDGDLDLEDDGTAEPDLPNEPDLGSLDNRLDQTQWGRIHETGLIDGEADHADQHGKQTVDDEDGHDAEDDPSDQEMFLGSLDRAVDQTRWSVGSGWHAHDDRELDDCDDEDGADAEETNEDGSDDQSGIGDEDGLEEQLERSLGFRMIREGIEASREASERLGVIIARLTGGAPSNAELQARYPRVMPGVY